jgi:outer membrane biosynthesis protein TonB
LKLHLLKIVEKLSYKMIFPQLLLAILHVYLKAIITNPEVPIPVPEPDPEPIPSPPSSPEEPDPEPSPAPDPQPDLVPELDPVPAPS